MKKSSLLFLFLLMLIPSMALGDLSNKQLENLIYSQVSGKVDKAAVVKVLGNPSGDNTIVSEKGLRKTVNGFLNMSSLPPTAVDSQVVVFKGSSGKRLKAASGSGMPKLTAGVLGFAAAGTDYLMPSGNGSLLTGMTPAQVGLGNVGNYAQTKADIVPNTAPSVGQILVGNAGGTAYAPVTVSGDGALSSLGTLTVTKSNGTAFGSAAFTDSSVYDPSGAAAAVTTASIGAPSGSGTSIGSNTGDVSIDIANGLSLSGQVLSLQAATDSVPGALTAADHTAFASKQNALTAGVDYLEPSGSAVNLTSFPTLNQNTSGSAGSLSAASSLPSGTTLNGSTIWTAANNTGSIASSGHYQFASGLVVQWGAFTATTGWDTAAFPTQFPNAVFAVAATPQTSTAATIAASAYSTTYLQFIGSTGSTACSYIAIGY